MDIYKFFSVVSGIVFASAFVPYIIAIVKRETKPVISSWVIWATLDTIAFVAMWVKETINGQIAAAVILSWSVVVLAMIFGEKGWTRLDKACLAVASLGVILWLAFNNAVFGIIASQSAIFIGSIPTFRHALKKPAEENKLAWFLYWLSCPPAVYAAMQQASFEALAQPINFLIIESIMVYLLFFKKRA